MALFAESEEDIFSDILLNVYRNTAINRTTPGSKTRSLVEAVSRKLGGMWNQFDLNMAHAFLDGAEGKYLDYIGDMMGMGRLGERPATVSVVDKLLKFYRATAPAEITIPVGTVVSTATGGGGIAYKTTVQVVMPITTGLEVYVPAISTSTGTSQNVGKETLIFHNLTSFLDLKVINLADINTAQSIEEDANFRFRIANQVFAAEAANGTSIRLTTLNVPGVADIVLIPFFRGVGTFDILIKSITPSVSDTLLETVREALTFVIAQGVSFDVRRPQETGVSMEFSITLKNTISNTEETDLKQSIQRAIIDYIDNLDIGEDLIINEIIQRVMEIDNNIKNIGSSGKPIEELLVYKQTETQDQKLSYVHFNGGAAPIDYIVEVDEKLLIHTDNIAVPVLVKIKD